MGTGIPTHIYTFLSNVAFSVFICFRIVPIHCLTKLHVSLGQDELQLRDSPLLPRPGEYGSQHCPGCVQHCHCLPGHRLQVSYLSVCLHQACIHTVHSYLHLCSFQIVSCTTCGLSSLAALHVGHEPSSIKKLIALFKKHYISQVGLVVGSLYCGDCMKTGSFSLIVCVPSVCRHSGTGCHRESCVFCERFCWRYCGLVL